jgi:uncharacterized SAM-binding protein YcdF (DUF218 family)
VFIRRFLRRLLLIPALVAGVVALGYGFADSLLTVRSPVASADLIIVLGGETPRRVQAAVDLYQRGVAKYFLVSGGGDAPIIRRYLREAGIPAEAILLEELSATTRENAKFTAPMLEKMHVRRAVLVTSWFHTRRALACFQAAAPGVEFHPVPAFYTWENYASPRWERFKGVYREYAKLLGYWVGYGISPFVKAPRAET